jgi:hypothetical protein
MQTGGTITNEARQVESVGLSLFLEVFMGKNTITTPQEAPYIKRTIDGRTYTVFIHFSQTNKETAQDKIHRMLKKDIQNETFTERFQTNF